MPPFVVLFHHYPEKHSGKDHFDLMIQDGSELATWRLDQWPPKKQLNLTQLPPHRLAYLEYEGPVSNSRGAVERVDSGECHFESQTSDNWQIQLEGHEFDGKLQLRKVEQADHWTLIVIQNTP